MSFRKLFGTVLALVLSLVVLTLRHAAEASEPPQDQVRAAAEAAAQSPPQQWPECKWVNERTCVSHDEWARMVGAQPEQEQSR